MQTYGRSLALGFGLAFAILCLVGGLSVYSAFQMENASARATQSYQRLRQLNNFEDALTAAETAQRAYLFTLDKAYLDTFEKANRLLEQRQAGLGTPSNWGDNALTLQRVTQGIAPVIQVFRDRMAQRATMSMDEVTRSPKSAESRKRMEALRTDIMALEEVESNVLDARTVEMLDTTRLVRWVAIGGVATGLVVVVLLGLALQRRLLTTVGGAAVDLTRQAEELQQASQLQAGAAKETASATVELSATMHQVQMAASQIAQRSQEVEEITAASTRAAQGGSAAMARAKDTVEIMRAQINRVVTQMTTLGREVQGASTVLATMEELAERTNILAINATIEAFSAGSAGDRFQVVADEIRRLAEKMRADAMSIKLQLEAIMNASNATIMSTEAGFKAVEASSQLFAEVNAALDLIATRVGASDTASREIRLATQQQSVAAHQLERALAEVNRAATEAEGATHRNLITAAAMTAMAESLRAVVTPVTHGRPERPSRPPAVRPA